MRRLLVAGNWKMYTDPAGAGYLASRLKASLGSCGWADIAIFPPFTSLAAAVDAVRGSGIAVGGQDLFWENEGAYTGEISPSMLIKAGCTMALIGHSERRAHFHETDSVINRKIKAALGAGLHPILCVGETLEQRESGITEQVIEKQLIADLDGIDEVGPIAIAYEPVWAIGTGKNATPEQASDVHKFIRQLIGRKRGEKAAAGIRILYGGSVKPDNAGALAEKEDIDGFLVGGASLKADSFEAIARCLIIKGNRG
jgi:triosephosphate isomerase